MKKIFRENAHIKCDLIKNINHTPRVSSSDISLDLHI
jgi:hypothetical protein